MAKEKQGVLVAGNQNPVTHLQTKYKELETRFNTWLAKQPLPIETAVVAVTNAVQGGAIGAICGHLNDFSSTFPPPPPGTALNPHAKPSFPQAQALAGGPLVQARNIAVVSGVGAGISCVMKKVIGKEDLQTTMAAAFGSGVVFSLVTGMGGPTQPANVISSGVLFALVQGGLFKVGEKLWQPRKEDFLYKETRGMLTSLGLARYEKNFKRGLLTDKTLHLLTDSALQDVKIPPGPRLIILDHIERENDVKKSG